MTEWIVKPLISVGVLNFNMTREEVHTKIGNPKREFKKTKFSKTYTDDYTDFHVFYNLEDKIEAIEIFENIRIQIEDNILFPQIKGKIKEMPYDFEVDADGFISKKYSIGIYAPHDKVESILLGEKDYYA